MWFLRFPLFFNIDVREDDDTGSGGSGSSGGTGGGGTGGGGTGGGGSGEGSSSDHSNLLPSSEDGVRTEYECRFRFSNEVYIDRFLLVLAGTRKVSATVIVKDERSDKQIQETFIAEQGMNTIRFKERLRADSVKVWVLIGQGEGTRSYTYDAWLGYDLLERMGGVRG